MNQGKYIELGKYSKVQFLKIQRIQKNQYVIQILGIKAYNIATCIKVDTWPRDKKQ